jgi:hypothetical protein
MIKSYSRCFYMMVTLILSFKLVYAQSFLSISDKSIDFNDKNNITVSNGSILVDK